MKQAFLGCLLMLASVSFAQKNVFVITDFGAKQGDSSLSTKAIQTAIDQVFSAGGGKVIVPKGSFITAPLQLKSGVELHIDAGGILLGSNSRLDYGNTKADALISAVNQQNISITGKGEIDGRGAEVMQDLLKLLEDGVLQDSEWKTKRPGENNRPKIFEFVGCKNIVIKGITIKNGATWIQDFNRCDGVVIDSITVQSTASWNNDGIDVVNSKNVRITHSFINASDDAIVIKSEGGEGWCENISVSDCKLRSSANAFKLGTGSHGGFKNIKVRNLEVYDTYRSAIALEAVDGGFLENVDIQNVNAVNTGNAIFIRLGHRNKDNIYSTIKNIYIANVKAKIPADKPDKGYPFEGPGLKYPPGYSPKKSAIMQSVSPWNNSGKDSSAIPYRHNVFPSSITGLPGHPVQNVMLENIEIIYEGSADKNRAYYPLDSLASITEAETAYPEFSMFGELPCWGMYVRHVEGLQMKNVQLGFTKKDFRAACIFDHVKGLSIHKLTIPSYNETPVIVLNNVANPTLKKIALPIDKKIGIKVTHLH